MPDDTNDIIATARVVAVQDCLVTIEAIESGKGPIAALMKNEIVHICPQTEESARPEKLKAEVLRIEGRIAVAQVFENTAGVGIGDPVEQSRHMLSVRLGPGLLAQVYDGLQNSLDQISADYGFFLPRGVTAHALDPNRKWSFVPSVHVGAILAAGDTIGTTQEGRFTHKIMVPFGQRGKIKVTWIQAGNFTVDDPVARIEDASGHERALCLMQEWPVRNPLPQHLLREGLSERLYPSEPMVTQQRLIDTFFPVARGGTGCIPGPFGAGKTVLQNLIARFSAVDIVIIVACGERAGEVVETIVEFPKLTDPKGGGSLMDRTIIIGNTSSMPVAAREASIFTGITLSEYYRQMGLAVLMIADSTSRWAQAMRETSGRMEEIPGEEGFPAYLDSSIRGIYERAGVIRTNDGAVGSLTMIGTVSPAGGNFEEPVTQSTLGTVKTFLGLSADRAYKRFYPAVDPLLSWSRYLQQLEPWYEKELAPWWTAQVNNMLKLLKAGDRVLQMMQVTGEEGVTMEDFLTYQKSLFIDMVYLQQDAFDPVDSATALDRQKTSFEMVHSITCADYSFKDKEAARDYFTRLTGLYKNFNYAREDSPEYENYRKQITEMLESTLSPANE